MFKLWCEWGIGLWKLIIPELRVLVLTKRHVGSGNEIGFSLPRRERSLLAGKDMNSDEYENTSLVRHFGCFVS